MCGLPDELLWLIFDHLFKDETRKADVWAVLGSCKVLKGAQSRYCADVRLKGFWNEAQILGAFLRIKHLVT